MILEVILGIASETYSCAPSPVQWAAIDAYDSYEKVLDCLSLQHVFYEILGRTVQRNYAL